MRVRKSLLAILLLVACLSAGALLREPKPGEAMNATATAFLESLSAEQRAQATMKFDDARRLDWHFIPKNERKGLQLREMNDEQKALARKLLEASLSQVGYKKADTIMDLEQILAKLEGDKARFKRDYLRYYFTIFGQPGGDDRWGLSIEGHHLSLNFVVAGDTVQAHTPAFFGANPALVKSGVGVGPKEGTQVLAAEEKLGFELLHQLKDDQRKQAVIAEKAPDDIRAAATAHPPQTAPEGLPAKDMSAEQVAKLQDLIETYAANMPASTAAARLAEIEKAGIEKVYFAWAGADKPGVGHYYRVQGPTFLIEFVNVQPDAAGNPANHIHSVWRNMAGDFGLSAKN